jgi:hypothetical protein
MTDDQNATPQSVERISLTDLYQALPEHLDTAEPFDVEAGLARLDAWIDGQQTLQSSPEPTAAAELELTVRDVHTGRSLEIAHALTPDLAARWLDLQEKRVALEEAHADAQALALRRRLEEEALDAAHRRELEAAEAAHRRELEAAHEAHLIERDTADRELRRTIELRKVPDPELEIRVHEETRTATRQLRARVLAVALPSATWLAGFITSVISHMNELSVTLGFGLLAIGSAYASAVLFATRKATGSESQAQRVDAGRILRFLLFREDQSAEELRIRDHVREAEADVDGRPRKARRRVSR